MAGQTKAPACDLQLQLGAQPLQPRALSTHTHLPAFDVRLQLLQGLQLLHLPLGLIDVGADGLHGLQGTLYCGVVRVLAGGPLGQLLVWEGAEKRVISPGAYAQQR